MLTPHSCSTCHALQGSGYGGGSYGGSSYPPKRPRY